MSRFLRKRHYKMAVVGVFYYKKYFDIVNTGTIHLRQAIYDYLNDTGISYTVEDVENIELAYKQKYGK